MATGPLETDAVASLRIERDALAQRCGEAEAEVRRLTEALSDARARVAAYENGEPTSLSFFDGEQSVDRLTGDGSDPRVLSLILGATAVVAGMVALLALINGKLGSVFGLAMVALTIGLAWAAARTRIVPVEVEFARGVVYIKQGETTHRFDLKKSETRIEVHGHPGDSGWAVHFLRRHMDPYVVDGSMVDPYDFTHQLKSFRPEL